MGRRKFPSDWENFSNAIVSESTALTAFNDLSLASFPAARKYAHARSEGLFAIVILSLLIQSEANWPHHSSSLLLCTRRI